MSGSIGALILKPRMSQFRVAGFGAEGKTEGKKKISPRFPDKFVLRQFFGFFVFVIYPK